MHQNTSPNRTLAAIFWIFGFFVLLGGNGARLAAAQSRPNILFIMSDDHCARAIGAYGLRLAKLNPTPNLDALARRGEDSPKYFDYCSVAAHQGRHMNPVMHTSEEGTMWRIRFDSTLVRDIEVVDTGRDHHGIPDVIAANRGD